MMLGPARRSRLISTHEKELTAHHEAGHAIVGHLLPHADPVAKVTILARGTTGGHTRSLPEEDRHMWTINQFKDMMAMAMGGRVAEKITFGQDEVTSGASNDLEQATQIARTMVTRYGMSLKLGPRTFGKREELVFLGKEISDQRDYGDAVAEIIDEEVHALIDEAYQRANKILSTHNLELNQLATYLLENETAEQAYLESLFDSKSPKSDITDPNIVKPTKPTTKTRTKRKPTRSEKPRPRAAKPSPATE